MNYRQLSKGYRRIVVRCEQNLQQFDGNMLLIKQGKRKGADYVDAVWAMRDQAQDERDDQRAAMRMMFQ